MSSIIPESLTSLLATVLARMDDTQEKGALNISRSDVVLVADMFDSDASLARISNDVGAGQRILGTLIAAMKNVPGITPTPDEYWTSLASGVSQRSASIRMAVGAVLVREDQVIAVGTNEVPLPGGVFNWPDDGVANDRRDFRLRKPGEPTRRERALSELARENGLDSLAEGPMMRQLLALMDVETTVHAEAAAIFAAAQMGTSTLHSTMYVTHRPCYRCVRLLTAAGVKRVVYDRETVSHLGSDLAEQLGTGLAVERFLGIHWERVRALKWLESIKE